VYLRRKPEYVASVLGLRPPPCDALDGGASISEPTSLPLSLS
jgi:hypothetical protein